jgi:lysophospholipase L1-like esterase
MFKKLPLLFAIILLLCTVFSSFASSNEMTKLTVVSLGDSITFGWNLEPNQNAQSQKAFPFLIGTGSNEVLNMSAPGWTSTQLFDSLEKNPATSTMLQQADVITLNIGANDVMQAVGLSEILKTQQPVMLTNELKLKVGQATATFAANLSKSISLIRQHTNAPILIYSMYNPFGENTENSFAASLHIMGEQITSIVNNQVIRQAASLPGNYYIDAYTLFTGKQTEYIIPGDIHPTEKGQQALAQIATNQLVELQQKK